MPSRSLSCLHKLPQDQERGSYSKGTLDQDQGQKVKITNQELSAETEVVEAEVLEAEVLEAEVLEAEVLEAEVLEAEVLEAEVLEAEVLRGGGLRWARASLYILKW